MLAIDVETGAHCAVKSIQHAGTKTEYLANELEIIRASAKQQHPCIVRFLAAVQEPGQTHFVLERAAGGSVQDLHMAQNQLPEYLVQAIARDVLRGLEFVHSLGFVHRDIKPANILISRWPEQVPRSTSSRFSSMPTATVPSSASACTPKGPPSLYPFRAMLADFGLARYASAEQPLFSQCGTLYYCAPEQLFQAEAGYHQPLDLWAVGVLVFVMLTGHHPFVSPRDFDELPKAVQQKYEAELQHVDSTHSKATLRQRIQTAQARAMLRRMRTKSLVVTGNWRRVSPAARAFVLTLLQHSPARRPSAAGAQLHPWLQACSDQGTTPCTAQCSQDTRYKLPTGQASLGSMSPLSSCQPHDPRSISAARYPGTTSAHYYCYPQQQPGKLHGPGVQEAAGALEPGVVDVVNSKSTKHGPGHRRASSLTQPLPSTSQTGHSQSGVTVRKYSSALGHAADAAGHASAALPAEQAPPRTADEGTESRSQLTLANIRASESHEFRLHRQETYLEGSRQSQLGSPAELGWPAKSRSALGMTSSCSSSSPYPGASSVPTLATPVATAVEPYFALGGVLHSSVAPAAQGLAGNTKKFRFATGSVLSSVVSRAVSIESCQSGAESTLSRIEEGR